MLYSIIPPILIILSLIGIIYLFMKKSNQVANLPPEEFSDEVQSISRNAGFFGRIWWKTKNIRWDDIKHFFLGILEQITRRSRMIFLKLESRFGNWSNDIRNKRKTREEKNSRQNSSIKSENDIIRKLKDYSLAKKNNSRSDGQFKESVLDAYGEEKINKNPSIRIAGKKTAIEEENIKPIISEKMVSPRPRTEIKDRLEELLIERIAVNPKDIEAYERLGEYYMEIKSYTDAKECFKQVIKLNPASNNARYRLKRLERLLATK
jgi:tetratricopeptide (TPR) repeat protein